MCGRELVRELSRRELPQGGWSFGGSLQPSVEATTLAILASAAEFPEVPAHSVRFLLSVQRGDGSWPAFKGDDDGSWTTAMAAMALSRVGGDSRVFEKATAWLLDTKGREAHWLWRWKFKTADAQAGIDPDKYGWPWIPGANSWVIPTAFAVIALKQFAACNPAHRLARVESDKAAAHPRRLRSALQQRTIALRALEWPCQRLRPGRLGRELRRNERHRC
jgi:hypothetical protein